jgi:hypothetical protein
MRTKTFLLFSLMLIAILLTACGGTALAQTPQAEENPPLRTISVTGNGKAYLVPDIAYVSIGVHTESKDAAEAVANNNSQSQRVADALDSFNIDPKDIQTTNFSIYPRQEYDREGKPQQITFVVDNTVYVTVRDLSQVGDILDAVVEAGANSISGIQFDVEDKTAALSEARQAAVADARTQAEELAQAAGVELGEVQSISTYNSYPVPMYDMRTAVMAESAAASVPVSPGQMILTVDVNAVYQIQ